MKKKTEIFSKKAPRPLGPYSQAVIFNNLVFCSGQIAPLSADIEEETAKIIENLNYILKEAGSSLEKIIKVEIFLVDIKNFEKVNKIYNKYFNSSPKPARQVVGVLSLPKRAKIEMSCIAYVK